MTKVILKTDDGDKTLTIVGDYPIDDAITDHGYDPDVVKWSDAE